MGPECDPVNNVWSFPKLTGQNYHTWSEQMQAALLAHYLWQYMTGDEPQPPKPPTSPPRSSAASSTEPITPVKATGTSTQSFASAAAGSKAPKPFKPQRLAGKGPDEEEADFDSFFYSPNYVHWEKAWEHYCTWVQNDGAARGLIKGAINPSQWGHISGAETFQDMWDRLYQLHFATRRDVNVHHYIQEIWHKHWGERVSMSNHIYDDPSATHS